MKGRILFLLIVTASLCGAGCFVRTEPPVGADRGVRPSGMPVVTDMPNGSSTGIPTSAGMQTEQGAHTGAPLQPTPATIKNDQFPPATDLIAPIIRASERVTKKPFGLYVTTKNSPVQPERFSGYHDAVDFEIFAEEQDKDVTIVAVCDGALLQKRTSDGYGGLVVQKCVLEGKPITVVYGHLKLSSVTKKVGETFSQGEVLGILGKGFSTETDGERKHLHLGIHTGSAVDVRGYVQNSAELNQWIDIRHYL